MFYVHLLIAVALGYLSGSVNYAILVARAVKGIDIRKVGNFNPGAANVSRSVGKPWGILTGTLDACKALIPMLLADLLFFDASQPAGILAIYAAGIAGVAGHCRPVYYRFKGGKGAGSLIGVFLYFTPVEFALSMLLAMGCVGVFIRGVEYRWGRWVPICFITIAPFLTLATALSLDIPLGGRFSFGGHGWPIVVGVFAASLGTLALNFDFMGRRVDEVQASKK